MGIAREVLLRASHSRWLADQLTHRRFTRRAVRRFMPGEELDDALQAAGELQRRRMGTILTLLGENITTPDEAESVRRHYLDVLNAIHEQQLDADISIKPTQLGLDLAFDSTLTRIRSLADRAADLGRTLAIDMEDSFYVDATLDLYRRLRADGSHVAVCLQSYLFRTDRDLEELLPLQPAIRLVKGAYKESTDIAYRWKRDVDVAFLRQADLLLQARCRDPETRVFFGTHDPKMVEGVCQRAEALSLPKDAYEFQMLYGIQRDLQSRLAVDGYRVRILISYGSSWFPWFMRRLAERPANVIFLLRNLAGR